MIKRAIRYLRISADKQSNYSITGQDLQTRQWCERNNVLIADTFTDEGFSARTFDRPDMKRLNEFIQLHHRTVHYLVVFDFTRFSRDAGQALVEMKNLQRKFQIKIVSAGEGQIADYDDPASFFNAGLRFLLGEDEINRNRARVNLGIYTAKKHEGRYLGTPPRGYKTIKDGRKTLIMPDEEKAGIIRYIFDAYQAGIPMAEIHKKANAMGLQLHGKSIINYILQNFVYTGLIKVKAYRDNPEELVEGIHSPIISRYQFLQVQEQLSPPKTVQILSDDFPLRHVLLCHCGKPLTGAPSKSHTGRYYPYYKCKVSGHNNINANFAHEQMRQIMQHLSLPQRIITATKDAAKEMMGNSLQQDGRAAIEKKRELREAEEMLVSVEKKWIENQMEHETYQRWYGDLSKKRMHLTAEIQHLERSRNQSFDMLQDELARLTDMEHLYSHADTVEKQQLLKMIFECSLYYQQKIYRTQYILPIFEPNLLKIKNLQLLILDNKKGISEKSPGSALHRLSIEPLTNFLAFIHKIKAA